jgi:hypothetical protein
MLSVCAGRHQSFAGGAVVGVIGLSIALFGYLRSDHCLARVSGVITESTVMRGTRSTGQRFIIYSYSSGGATYTGSTTVRYSPGHDDGYSVGSPLPVYVAIRHPTTSYGFEPPHSLPFVIGGFIVVAVGGIIVFFGWRQ